ncbi:MAG: peptidase [Lentisphaerae bacterium]|nr:peptidase [Lentisphaerota bacterium]
MQKVPDSRESRRKLLMVFVDGLGLGRDDPATNPITPDTTPVLHSLLRRAVPLDATLGVPGIPQSATGQATLLTGVNAAKLIGRHLEGFPNQALRELVSDRNIFGVLAARGVVCTFANAYFAADVDAVRQARRQSVTTVAALSGVGVVRCRDSLERNEAVCHDITRETLGARGYAGPVISPEEGAEHLAAIAARHGFSLFEHFMTDRAGHSMDMQFAVKTVRILDRFLAALLPACRNCGVTLLLTSDHGNIEDLSTPCHTLNPVPLSVTPEPVAPPAARRIEDVAPSVLEYLS